jgi:hypothetical protein
VSPNNSFKLSPHRGFGHVPALRQHASATPLRGGLTQALGSVHFGTFKSKLRVNKLMVKSINWKRK